MADNDGHIDELEHPRGGHEERDINAIAVTRFGIGLTLTIIASAFLLWGLFNYFLKEDGGPYPSAAPLATTQPAKVPPAPRLQTTPRMDLREIRAAEDKALNSYSWADQANGKVRIPIDRAMDLLVQRGLPARTQAPPAVGSQNNPTQSSGGAILQQPGGPLAPELAAPSAPPASPAEGTKKK
jgi:hypothetical protein